MTGALCGAFRLAVFKIIVVVVRPKSLPSQTEGKEAKYANEQRENILKNLIVTQKCFAMKQDLVRNKENGRFSDLRSPLQSTPFQYWDAYEEEFAEFQLFDGTIVIHNEILAHLLNRLSPFNRNIILMSIWMEMSDREIGEHLHISRSSVQYKRTNILREMREAAEEKDDEK